MALFDIGYELLFAFHCKIADFYRVMLCIARTMPSQDFCLSVCLSHASILSNRLYIFLTFFHCRVTAPFYYFFLTKHYGNIRTGGVECKGYEKVVIFDQYLYLGNNTRQSHSFKIVAISVILSNL